MVRRLWIAMVALFSLYSITACEMVDDTSELIGEEELATINGNVPQPDGFTKLGSYTYFIAANATYGKEIFRMSSTGTTSLFKDINPGTEGSFPQSLMVTSNPTSPRLFFFADDGVNGYQLWTSNGTTTSRVTSLPAGTFLLDIATTKNYAAFAFLNANYDLEVWKTNGTTVSSAAYLSNFTIHSYTTKDDYLYFITSTPSSSCDPNTSICHDIWQLWQLNLASSGGALAILSSENALEMKMASTASKLYISLTVDTNHDGHADADTLYSWNYVDGTYPTLATLNGQTSTFLPGSIGFMTTVKYPTTSSTTYFYFMGAQDQNGSVFTGIFRLPSAGTTLQNVGQTAIESVPMFAVVNNALYFRSGNDLRKASNLTVTTVKAGAGSIEEMVSTNETSSGYLFYFSGNRSQLWRSYNGGTPSQVTAANGTNLEGLFAPSTSFVTFTDETSTNFRLRKCTTSGSVSNLSTTFI